MSVRKTIVIFCVLALCGCSQNSTDATNTTDSNLSIDDRREVVSVYDEVTIDNRHVANDDDLEDLEILKALVMLDEGNLHESSQMFKALWETSKKPEYLKQSLGIRLEMSRFGPFSQMEMDLLLKDVHTYLSIDSTSQEVRRTLIALLTAKKDLQGAKQEAQNLIKVSENEENYELLGSVLFVNGDIQGAQNAFSKAYSFNESAMVLERLASIMPPKQAIALVETHVRFKGCEERLCLILGDIYKKEKNFVRAEEIYAKLYNQSSTTENLQPYLNILLFNKHYAKATELLEENVDYDKVLLLDLYREQKQTQKAISLAKDLFAETKETRFITIEALLEYENLEQPIQKQSLNPIIDKLKRVAESGDADDLIYNFLGYLLIDHQVDIRAGIGYVQKALEQKPDLPAYLDSLGWGYFYLKDCQKALEVFDRIPESERNKEPDIKEHYEHVKACTIREMRTETKEVKR